MPYTFGMNEKAGKNAVELDKCIQKAMLPLHLDIANVPGKCVTLKVNIDPPGQMNLDVLATL